uniref:Derlin n=1 Tax=Ditylum brightwellii TaxID=49249 RepID=A0A7S1ZIK9_9STRA|mmetsp:Transcript_3226/g.4897  ORF Transcript_3226/g.4897 Transcript_3226/m.4897 type:complete len:323 (+) Transcript_3226:239-1207(+)
MKNIITYSILSILLNITVVVNGTAAPSFHSSSLLTAPPSSTFVTKLSIRGGAILDSDDSEYDFDSDFSDDDDAFFDLNEEDFEISAEDDFNEDTSLSRFMEAFAKTPPFTKAYMTASFIATSVGYLTSKNDFPPLLQLNWKPTLTRLQLWRPITAFLNFGPLGLGYIMTCHFVWTYMATLERLNHAAPYDFWVMILFGCASMVAGYSCLGLSPRFLGHNLSTFLVYVWSRYHEGMEVNMFELFNTRAEMLPWFFLAQTFLLEGELPVLDLLGIVFGHIYHHYKTTHVLRTPTFLINWYNSDGVYSTAVREKYKKISSDFEMQ